MAIAERTAATTWKGGLARGHGTIRPASDAFGELPVTWAARTEAPDGKTSPEELAAAAHSSCFAMALSSVWTSARSRQRRSPCPARSPWTRWTANPPSCPPHS